MLSSQAINTAAAQVANMDARNTVIRPMPGTVLDTLVRACHVPDSICYREQDEWRVQLQDVANYANSSDSIVGYSEFDKTKAELVKLLSAKVTQHLIHARTVVAPAIEHFVENVVEPIRLIKSQIAHDFQIVTEQMPVPLNDASLLDAIKKAEEVLPREFELPIVILGERNFEELLSASSCGSALVDGVVEGWMSGLGEKFVMETWRHLFGDSRRVNASDLFTNDEAGINRLLLAFVWSRCFFDNPPANVNSTLAAFNDSMSVLREQAATRICIRIHQEELMRESGSLVLSSFGNKIVVNGAIYSDWLNKGGENEVLLGNALKTRPLVHLSDIDADAANCKAAWYRYVAMNGVSFNNRIFVRIKDLMRVEFARLMSDTSAEDMPIADREQIARLFKTALDESTLDESKDLHLWVARLLCSSWFFRSDAYFILKCIADIRQQNDKLSASEAAAITTVRYVARWVAGQMTKTQLSN